MSTHSETQIEQDALQIPAKARLRLAAKLLASVPASSRPSLNEEQTLYLAEQRAAELDSGEVEGVDYSEVTQRLRNSFNL